MKRIQFFFLTERHVPVYYFIIIKFGLDVTIFIAELFLFYLLKL